MIGAIEDRDSLTRYLDELCAVWGNGTDPRLPYKAEQLLEQLLASAHPFEPWISALIRSALPAKELHRDSKRGFIQVGYIHEKGRRTTPHDHGPCWVLHGVYHGVTEITTYTCGNHGKSTTVSLELKETRRLTQGIAVVYLPGEIHSTFVSEPSVIFTLFSQDPKTVPRNRYQFDGKAFRVHHIEPPS